ncbi:MAG: hypothetical protein COX44_01140 [Candidatus Portnoybacteria bacterium CG23_combo_of_CG06-09_8_20_14_all_37_13]|uniref:Uncharacterized protein n=1 Tax=Candidatus Portnoybacteria bacterium CG23_combo_of_CG06-09_8_20_14_all_37_13 TaxID=1974819 RepID=A0A2G9YDB3_9BACT|nr:MAG: hypothetical protein COX44_01140 [Candidatus Portnoybacteria bacterium CG23_combo_of_CG06-09_8_20_14_all_37_13]
MLEFLAESWRALLFFGGIAFVIGLCFGEGMKSRIIGALIYAMMVMTDSGYSIKQLVVESMLKLDALKNQSWSYGPPATYVKDVWVLSYHHRNPYIE